MIDTADIAAGNSHKDINASNVHSNDPTVTKNTRTPKQNDSITQTRAIKRSSDKKSRRKRPSLLRRQSSLFLTHLQSSLPATPTAWALFTLSTLSAVLQYELRLQRSLSSRPDVFCNLHKNDLIKRLYEKLSKEGGIWERHVVPSLFVGTRGVMSSVAAYALKSSNEGEVKTTRVREVMTMGADGAKLVLDWEIPLDNSKEIDGAAIIHSGKVIHISRPVVLLVHGMNNDSSFGYIRSMMKTATSRGWVAICMNLRGQDWLGEVKNTTPRGVSFFLFVSIECHYYV